MEENNVDGETSPSSPLDSPLDSPSSPLTFKGYDESSSPVETPEEKVETTFNKIAKDDKNIEKPPGINDSPGISGDQHVVKYKPIEEKITIESDSAASSTNPSPHVSSTYICAPHLDTPLPLILCAPTHFPFNSSHMNTVLSLPTITTYFCYHTYLFINSIEHPFKADFHCDIISCEIK